LVVRRMPGFYKGAGWINWKKILLGYLIIDAVDRIVFRGMKIRIKASFNVTP
jgi:hypothetical protein